MPESNYYDDGPSDNGMNEAQSAHKDDESEMDGEETTIIPKSVTGGKTFEVGDEIVLEVIAIHEDELEVKYASEKGGDKEPMTDKEPSMARATANNSDSSSYMD